jgi:hypothetical protein
MTDVDDHLRAVLVRSLDRELGGRLDRPDRLGARPRPPRRWVLPVAAAAAAVVVAGVAVATTALVGHDDRGAGGDGVQVVCRSTDGTSPKPDVAAIRARATQVAHGDVRIGVHGDTLTADVPGADRADVAGLCAPSSFALRPMITRPVAPSSPSDPSAIGALGFPLPTTDTAYRALTAAQRSALDTAVAETPCGPASGAGPVVVCSAAGTTRSLFGPPLAERTTVVEATAEPPQASAGTTQWTLTLRLDHATSVAWASWSARHVASDDAAGAASCGVGNACGNYLGYIVNGRTIEVPVTVSALAVDQPVAVAGSFTRATARTLARELTASHLPVELSTRSIETTG